MLSPEELRRGPTGNSRYLESPLKGLDIRHLEGNTIEASGSAVIEAVKAGFTDKGQKFTHEQMLSSIRRSLRLTEVGLRKIIPDAQDETKTERTFYGLVYVSSIYPPELFASGMRVRIPSLGGSYLDALAEKGIDFVVGKYYRVFGAEGGH